MSDIIIQKFGGTSVGSVERIDIVAEIIKNASKLNKLIVVVSAMGGETNKLIELSKYFGENPDKREFDALVSTGETVSSALLSMALHSKGIKAKSYSAAQISMKTTDSYSKAKILDVNADKILEVVKDGPKDAPVIDGRILGLFRFHAVVHHQRLELAFQRGHHRRLGLDFLFLREVAHRPDVVNLVLLTERHDGRAVAHPGTTAPGP